MTSKEIRQQIIKSSYEANACHIGSALSCVEIIKTIYETKKQEDIFVFGKASGVCCLYSYLHPERAAELIKKYPLPSKEVEGIIWSGGSLGQGLSVACGLALGDRNRKVYCLISDGELQEGQTWEAIMFANQHKLNNLVVIIDRNFLQALGNTEDICKLEPISYKLEDFGWKVTKPDGHNEEEIKRAIETIVDKPKAIIAYTIKGKGVSFMEDRNDWHYRNLTQVQKDMALNELR